MKIKNWRRCGYRKWKNSNGEILKVKTISRGSYVIEFKGVPIQEKRFTRVTECINTSYDFMREFNNKVSVYE